MTNWTASNNEIVYTELNDIFSWMGSFKRDVTQNDRILDTPPYVTLFDHFFFFFLKPDQPDPAL